jgi:hypothetical protein
VSDREQDAANAARGLTAALDQMSRRLEEVREDGEARIAFLAAYGRRNRRLILATIGSLVLDITLTIILAVVAVQAHEASVAARHASASNLALCQSANVARHQQISLWDFVLNLPSSHRQTAQEKRNVVTFEAYLKKIYAPRDCAALGRHSPR